MKGTRIKSLWTGSIIAILIVISPYLLYFHNNIPPGLENLSTFIGTIKSGYYSHVQLTIYFFFGKFVPLFLLIIWFLTNKHWWVHALIIPISVYLFQLISVINDSEEWVDEVEFIYTVPITVGILVILYFLRTKLSVYIQAVDLKKEMDEEMDRPLEIKKKKF